VVIGNSALEEFLERLLRWDELCSQLRELYYRYLDLAAFRSEKCFFPGRRCKRSWKREYDMGDLTLMWTYIANTAPLCGKLARALAEIEYEIRKRALESLEKYGGVEKRRVSKTREKLDVTQIHLNNHIYSYLVLLDKNLYIIFGEFDDLSRDGRTRSVEIERRIIDIIGRYKQGKDVNVEVVEFEIDSEYRRLWFEVPLPEDVSKLLGGKDKAPIAIFRNLGWLLSDDARRDLRHGSNNIGQLVIRIFDWIALIKYAIDVLRLSSDRPLVFKLAVYDATKTRNGINPLVSVWAIGTTVKILETVYKHFGIVLGKTESVLMRGYAILKALRLSAIKLESNKYVVDDVGAWIAFSNALTTLILGDGTVAPYELRVAAKSEYRKTLNETASLLEKIADALGGTVNGHGVVLQWHMRMMLPTPPIPVFEKVVMLYDVLTNYLAAVEVKINGNTYLLCRNGGRFSIRGEKAKALYDAVTRLGLRAKFNGDYLHLTYPQLVEMAQRGVFVKFLNDKEKDLVREVKPVPAPDLETVKSALITMANVVRISPSKMHGMDCFRIALNDKSKLEEVTTLLTRSGIRFFVMRRNKEIWVCERRSVETFRMAIQDFFQNYERTASAFTPLSFTFLMSKRRRRRGKRKIHCPSRRLPSALRS